MASLCSGTKKRRKGAEERGGAPALGLSGPTDPESSPTTGFTPAWAVGGLFLPKRGNEKRFKKKKLGR